MTETTESDLEDLSDIDAFHASQMADPAYASAWAQVSEIEALRFLVRDVAAVCADDSYEFPAELAERIRAAAEGDRVTLDADAIPADIVETLVAAVYPYPALCGETTDEMALDVIRTIAALRDLPLPIRSTLAAIPAP